MTIIFENLTIEHNEKINEFLTKENITKDVELSERKNETEKSYIYFVKINNEVMQLTINKESGKLMPRKGNYKMDDYKWEKGKIKRKGIINLFKKFMKK